MSSVSEQRQIIAAELADVNTCLPGVVVSYDGNMLVAKPSIDKQMANGETLAAPSIVQVPVCWPCGDVAGTLAMVTVPLKPGDAVLLCFSARAVDDWISGTDGPPGDPRQFDLSDAFAIPMMRPGTVPATDLENLSVQYGEGSMKISPEGAITFKSTLPLVMDVPMVTLTGNLNVIGTTVGAGVDLNTHTHTGVEPGDGNSGPPVGGGV